MNPDEWVTLVFPLRSFGLSQFIDLYVLSVGPRLGTYTLEMWRDQGKRTWTPTGHSPPSRPRGTSGRGTSPQLLRSEGPDFRRTVVSLT